MEVRTNPSFEELLNCCRCCSKYLVGDHKAVKISKAIKSRFLQLTGGMDLIDSEYYSNIICESCNSKLSEYSDFRTELVEYQQYLYGICVEETVVQEEEYLLDVDMKNEEETTMMIESIGDDDYIVEEVESIEQITNENELIITGNSEMYHMGLKENSRKFDIQDASALVKKKSEKTKICHFCNQIFASSGFYHHMMRFHKNECRYECDFCSKRFNLKNDLIMHIKKHLNRENRKKFPCNACTSVLLSNSALSNHERHFHSNIIEIHPCEYCHKTFKSRMKYLQHRRLVHDNTGEFQCPICQNVFSTRSYLEKHIENVHGELKPCQVCGKMYKPASLKRHQLSHGDKRFKCPFENCDKVYQMKISLKHHTQAHHEIKESINCEHCGTGFPTKRHLARHIQRQHTAEKLECEVVGCTSLFSRKDYLAEHYKKHKDIDEDTKNELLIRVKEIKGISW